MVTRKTEWLASIKPILDKEEVKNDAKALAKELSDILEFKVTDADSFEQLTKEFNKQLSNMGKQQIVFSEKTLQGIVSQFANAVAAGFAKGADIGIQESLKTLKVERDKFVDQQKKLQTKKKKFKQISDWTYDIQEMKDNEFHFFNSDEINAMEKTAKKIGISFDDYVLKIKKEVEELQYSISKMAKGEKSWDSNVIEEFYSRSHDMFRMSKTLSKTPNLVQDKEILEDYDFANLKDMFAEDLYEYADRFDAVVARIDKSLDTVKTKIEEINIKLKTAEENSGAIVDNQGLKDGLKTLQEIEEAYDKILTKDKNRPQRPDQKKVQSIQKALGWQPTGTEKDDGIKVVAQQYHNAKDTGDWVQEYKALLKYIRLYESYLKSENKTYRNKITKPGNDFTKLYDQLKPMYENAQNALRDLVNKAMNQPLVSLGGAGGESSGITSEDVAHAEKIAESKKLAIENDEKSAKVEQEAATAAEQKRFSNEASVKATKEELVTTENLLKVIRNFDSEYRNKAKPGDKRGMATRIDSKTSELDRWVVGDRGSVNIPGRNKTDYYSVFGDDKYRFNMGAHTHLTDFAAPSPYVKDVTENGDLHEFKERLEVQRFQLIRAMQEALFLDFDQISKESLEQLINDYDKLGEEVYQQFSSMPMADKLRKFGSISGSEEAMQEALKEGFLKLVNEYHGFATYIQEPMFPDVPPRSSVIPKRNTKFDKNEIQTKDVDVNNFERVKQEANAHQENAQAIKNETKAQEELNNAKVQGSGTGDTSSADVDAANAEAEKQRIEKERIEAEKLALQQENEAKLKAEVDAKAKLQADLNAANQQLKDVQEAKVLADANIRKVEDESRVKDGIIQELREQLTQVQSGDGGAKSSIDVEELKNALNAITYNVKVVQDTDSTDNKVSINETSLKTTLNEVFANIFNPQTRQNDGENNQSPWALESTLQTVKGVLDSIQTNTAKIGTVNASNVDTIAGTALDGRLVEIKTVLDSIDNKIAKGGIIATRGAVKQASADTQEAPAKAQAARSNMMKSIINDYDTLGKLSAQFANDGNLETKAKLENLKEEIKRKRESLTVTMEENAKLREQYSLAFDAQKRLLDAAEVQRDWKKLVKDAQRETGINAADSAYRAANDTVLKTIGTKNISSEVSEKAKELSDQVSALRILRDKIFKYGEKASEKDRDDLSKQISAVKTLKSELDGYLKIHEKYSGDNAQQFDDVDTSNFGAVGTNEYWNNITRAIQEQTKSRVIIKGMNADTGELTGTTKIAANTFAQWSATVDPITGRLSMLRTGIKKTEKIAESIIRKTREIFTYFSGSSVIFKIFNGLKQGVQYVRDIDLAMTELKKVTDETEETYDRFLQTAAKTADKVGSTIKDVVSSTADWARLNI